MHSLIKSESTKALLSLRNSAALARRGLRDAGFIPGLDKLLQRSAKLFDADQYMECIKTCTEVLAHDPYLLPALYYRALSHEFRLEYKRALADLDRALQVAPYNATLIAHTGICLWLSGDAAAGETWLDRALDLDPHVIPVLYHKAISALDETEALGWWQKLAALRPRDLMIQIGLAESLSSLGRYRDAIAAFEEAITNASRLADINDIPVYMKLSECYHRIGRQADARRLYRLILSLDPHNLFAKRALPRKGGSQKKNT